MEVAGPLGTPLGLAQREDLGARPGLVEVAVPGFPEPRATAPSTVLLMSHGAAVILMMVISYYVPAKTKG